MLSEMFHYGNAVTITVFHYTLSGVFFQGVYLSNHLEGQKNLNFYSNQHFESNASFNGVPARMPAAPIAFQGLIHPAYTAFKRITYPANHQRHEQLPLAHVPHMAAQPYRKSGTNPDQKGYDTYQRLKCHIAASFPP